MSTPESIIAIGFTLFWPGVLGRRTVGRFEDGRRRPRSWRRRETEAADQAGAEVGDDISVEVRQDEDVVLLGPLHELHRQVVHDPVIEATSGFSSATSRATWRNSPSVNFMMLALCTAVTLRRPLARA